MSKTLDAMTFGDWVWGGTDGYARYTFSDDFVDENGVRFEGSPSYIEVPTTIVGRVVTIPAYPNFPETEAAVLNNGVTVTCTLLDSTRNKKAILFDSVRIYTSLPPVINLTQLVTANGASRLLRDTDVWTKEQVIDYVETRPPAQKMTALVHGIGRASVAPVDPADPIVVMDNDPRLSGAITSTLAGLPAAGTQGRLRKLTDSTRSIVVDTGSQWPSITGDVYDVKLFGAKGDGSTDDTAAIQDAISAAEAGGGGEVFFPPGTYKVTTSGSPLRALYISSSNITLRGVKGKSRIANASATGDTLQIGTAGGANDANDCAVIGLLFHPSVTRTSGNEIFAPAYNNLTIRECKFKAVFRGFYGGSSLGCTMLVMSNVRMDNFYQGIFLVRSIGGYFFAVETDGLRDNSQNLVIDGYCEGNVFVACLFINLHPGPKTLSFNLVIDNTVVSRPSQFNYFYGCYFDFGNYGVVATDSYSFTFTDCWFKGQTDTGVLLESTAHEFTFNGCDFFNSGTSGIYINGSTGHVITGCRILNNGTLGTNPGVRITGAAAGIIITGNRIGLSGAPRISDGGSGSQNYGVQIDAGATSFVVKDNNCLGNSTGAVNNLAGTSANKVVADNIF